MKAHAVVVPVVVGLAFLATGVASAGSGPAMQAGHPQSAADASRWLTPSVVAEIKAKGIAEAAANPSVAVNVTFAGFAYCGSDVAVAYPAYDSTHQSTLTLPVIIYATMADFSDAQVFVPDWYLTQSGTQFTFIYTNPATPPSGPWPYWEAWSTFTFTTGTHDYVELANAIWTEDGNVLTGPDIRFLQALGPNVSGSPICHL